MYLLALKRNFQVTWEYTVESAVNVVYAVRAPDLGWSWRGSEQRGQEKPKQDQRPWFIPRLLV